MKCSFYTLLLMSVFFTACGFAKEVTKLTRRPAISIEDAIAKAKKYVQEKKIDVSQQYIDSVALDLNPRGDRGKFWRVAWQQNQFMKGGQTYIEVYMDGSVEHRHGK